ncbi:unnamed protein product [Auanema sp. JU1783]|nr:unnamed protein product [Auanema sp. JU1783]
MRSFSLVLLMLIAGTNCYQSHPIVDNSASLRKSFEIPFLADEQSRFAEQSDMNTTLFEYSGGPRVIRSSKSTRGIHGPSYSTGTSITSMKPIGKPGKGLPPPCYVNTAGYVCCSRELEQLMISKYYELANMPRFNNCNINKITNYIQNACQQKFSRKFEVVTGLDDYSQKIHFYGAFVCKIEINGRFIMGYATPVLEPLVTAESKTETNEEPYLKPSSSYKDGQ